MAQRPRLRLIGDVHGKIDDYMNVRKGADYSIQLGDMGFVTDYERLGKFDERHRFIEGNHDDYDFRHPNRLGEFGVHTVPGFSDIFFLRGAWSIDWRPRLEEFNATGRKSWWEQEELSWKELEAAVKLYEQTKPVFMISHDCPESIRMEIADPNIARQWGLPDNHKTRTGLALQAMFDSHQPHYWFFGHWHKSFDEVRNGTRFVCLKELETFDFKKKLVV